jgi:simple sugar transport system permease protein
LGLQPVSHLRRICQGRDRTAYRLRQTIHKAIPLVVLPWAWAVAFRMRFWNIGAEGQMLMGAYGASYVALFYPTLPAVPMLLLMAAAGLLCGGLWALAAAGLRIKFGTSETLVTLIAQLYRVHLDYVSAVRPVEGPQGGRIPENRGFLWTRPFALGFRRAHRVDHHAGARRAHPHPVHALKARV